MWEIKALYRLPWRVLFPAIPALLIRTSTPPKLFLTHLKAATISSSFETSAFTAYSAPLHPLTLFFSSCANIVEFYCGLHIQMESGQEILATNRETTRQWRTVSDWFMCVLWMRFWWVFLQIVGYLSFNVPDNEGRQRISWRIQEFYAIKRPWTGTV